MALITWCPRCGQPLDVSRQERSTLVHCQCGASVTVPSLDAPDGLLVCPGCGAPATAGCRRCHQCRASLSTLLCPTCFGLAFVGARHCSQCGGNLPEQQEARPLDVGCPRCSGTLVRQAIGDARASSCQDCAGVWLDHVTFDELETTARQRPGEEGAEHAPPPPPQPADTPVYIPCPECRQTMRRTNFGDRSGVIVDVCSDHGMWFDAEELSAVMRFIQSGGSEGADAVAGRAQPGGDPPPGRFNPTKIVIEPVIGPFGWMALRLWRTARR